MPVIKKPQIMNAIVPIEKLKPHKRNYRYHPEKQLQQLEASHQRFGQFRSVVLWQRPNDEYIIVAGHGIVEGMRRDGAREVRADILPIETPQHVVDGILVADNLHTQNSRNEEDILAQLLVEQKEVGNDLFTLGAEEELLNKIILELSEEETHEERSLPVKEIIEPRSALGEIWRMGNHRLFVGDCTDKEGINALFEGEKIDIVVTSPPYADQREYGKTPFCWNDTLCNCFERIIENSAEGSNFLFVLGPDHKERKVHFYWNDWLVFCAQKNWPLFGWYVWDKGSGMPGDWNGRLAPAHEFIFHFNQKKRNAKKWVKTKGLQGANWFRKADGSLKEASSKEKQEQSYKIPDSVLRISREVTRGIHTQHHPAVYPLELPEFLLRTWSDRGDNVYDPFCGSGTSILAAEALQRCCFACEIHPSYADLIIERWERFTQQKSECLGKVL